MPETLLTIQEAASLSDKSIQTIRRALKAKKIQAKKKRTPQGFNYLVTQESLASFYKLGNLHTDRGQGTLKKESKISRGDSSGYATFSDLQKFQHTIEDLLSDHQKEKENFMRLMKAFQDRFVVMENQLKLLEDPKKKRWFQFWR